MKIISVANQKGGVGKTTTVVNIATALAALNKKVLVIDFDPQGNASTGMGVVGRERKVGTYDVICGGRQISECLIQSPIPGLYLLVASPDLAGAEVELVYQDRREYILKERLDTFRGKVDYVIIDCPPALGLLTINALTASDRVLIPLQCEFYALDGLSQLIKTIHRVQRAFNPHLKIDGIALTMFDKRSALSELVAEDVRHHFGELVYKAVIPRSVKISESPSHGQPVLIYDVKSSGSYAYMQLAGEILQRQGGYL